MTEAYNFITSPDHSWFNNIDNTKIFCNSKFAKQDVQDQLMVDFFTQKSGRSGGSMLLKDVVKHLADSDPTKLPCRAPKITGISQKSTILSSKTVLLRCVAEGLPKPTIAWIAPNNDVYRLNSDNFKGVSVEENGDLKIESLKLTDTGEYTCQATSNSGSGKNNVVQVATSLTIIDKVDKEDNIVEDNNSEELNKNPEHSKEIDTNEHCPSDCDCNGDLVDCSLKAEANAHKLTRVPKFSDNAKKVLAGLVNKVYLQNNAITSLDSSICDIFNRLVELKADENMINWIQDGAFENCKNLQTLSLRHNDLDRLESGMFDRLPRLTTLILDNNRFTSLGQVGHKNGPDLIISDLNWANFCDTFPSQATKRSKTCLN